MRRTQSRLLTVTAIAAAAMLLGGCAQADASEAPAAPKALASAEPTTSATPSPAAADGEPGTATPPEGAVELVGFETQNGSMRLQVPAAWSVDDRSATRIDGDRLVWDNTVVFEIGDGSYLWYWDGASDNVGALAEQRVIERVEIGGGLEVATWWNRYDDHFEAIVAVVSGEPALSDSFQVEGSDRLHFLRLVHPDAQSFTSSDAAEAFLRSADVALAVDVLATAEVGGGDAMPAALRTEHEGTTYVRYTTMNGTASFLMPEDWTIRDDSRVGSNRAGQRVWDNAVTVYGPGGSASLHYSDMWFGYPDFEELEWTLGEVRPTQTDGWQAVSWAYGDSVPNDGGRVMVSLVDDAGSQRPHGDVCTANLCRSFSSLPLDVRWFEPELASTEAFFGSEVEEQMLTVVASLETHHDDATRMP